MAPALNSFPERNQVHVWYLDTTRANVLRGLEDSDCLSEGEREKLASFRTMAARQNFLWSRSLRRFLLSAYTGHSPATWRFKDEGLGKPEILGPRLEPPLFFNLSHCDGLIACAFAATPEVGIDAEKREAVTDADLASASFSASELENLRQKAEPYRSEGFFRIWTLKEAYLKARGAGFALPSEQISMEIGTPIRVSAPRKLEDRPESWRFALLEPTPDHQIAVALRSDGDPTIQERFFKPPF